MSKIIKNALYQGMFQVLSVLLPLITVPIVSHRIGPNGLGLFNYSNSIVNYFVLFAGLGLVSYGVREIAAVRDNLEMMKQTFWELEWFNIVFSLIATVVYIILSFFLSNSWIYHIQLLIMLGTVLDISWFFAGIEDFKLVSLVSIFVKLVSFFLIITYIQSSEDLPFYVMIVSMSSLLSQCVFWPIAIKKVGFRVIPIKKAFRHFRGAFSFFTGRIASTVYTNLNKTLLGLLTSVSMVAYFSNSVLIINVIVTMLTTIDTVLLPRMTNMVSKNEENSMILLLKKSIHLELFLTIPMMFGLIAIAPKFVFWFFGVKFLMVEQLLIWMSILLVIIPLSSAVVRQYLMPKGKMKEYNYSMLYSALVSIILDIILIPLIGIFGAVIATLVAEFLVSGIRVYYLVRDTDFNFDYVELVKYLISGILMLITVRFVTNSMVPTMLTTLLQVLLGATSYVLVLILTQSKLITYFLHILRRKLNG